MRKTTLTKFELSALIFAFLGLFSVNSAWAGVDGSVAGSVVDSQGIAVPGVVIKITATFNNHSSKQTQSSTTGDYQFSGLTIGDYSIAAQAPGYAPYRTTIHVNSVGVTPADIQLEPQGSPGSWSAPQKLESFS